MQRNGDGNFSIAEVKEIVRDMALQPSVSLLTFPTMSAEMIKELDCIGFSVVDDVGEAIDMRFKVSAWTREENNHASSQRSSRKMAQISPF
jgi:hypothetical protein